MNQIDDNMDATNDKKISVYRFPKDPCKRERRREVIPTDNLIVNDETVICASHWPTGFETVKRFGKFRPINPPSVWKDIPLSQVPTVTPPLRTTKKASSSVRNHKDDELLAFLEMDKATFTDIKNGMLANTRTFVSPVTAFMVDSNPFIQSTVFVEGIPLFMVTIYENLQFDTFHCRVKCCVNIIKEFRNHR